jgi:hypothetical protein
MSCDLFSFLKTSNLIVLENFSCKNQTLVKHSYELRADEIDQLQIQRMPIRYLISKTIIVNQVFVRNDKLSHYQVLVLPLMVNRLILNSENNKSIIYIILSDMICIEGVDTTHLFLSLPQVTFVL